MTDRSNPVPLAHVQRPLKGVLLVVAATLIFAAADVLGKHLMMRHPVAVVQAGRYLVNLVLLLALLGPSMGKRLWQTNRQGMVTLRGLALAAASLTMGLALQRMPVGETVAIVYLAPFLVMLLAVPLLGERVTTVGWIGATVAFAGVLLVVRPGTGLAPLGVTFALINAVFSTGYHLLTRVLSRSETTLALLFHVALTGFAVFVLLALPSLPSFAPTAADIGLIVVLGGLATLGHFLFTAAYREAPASMLAPINYLHLVWAALLGWGIFAHVPDGISLLGMALVVLAGAAVALRAGTRAPAAEPNT